MENEQVYNTGSKRHIQNGGQQYKKLIIKGYFLDDNNNLLPPKNLIKKIYAKTN
jgi:hypothetical protein